MRLKREGAPGGASVEGMAVDRLDLPVGAPAKAMRQEEDQRGGAMSPSLVLRVEQSKQGGPALAVPVRENKPPGLQIEGRGGPVRRFEHRHQHGLRDRFVGESPGRPALGEQRIDLVLGLSNGHKPAVEWGPTSEEVRSS